MVLQRGEAEGGGRRGRRDKQEHTGCGFGDSGPAGLQAWSQSTKEEEGKQREGGGGQNPPNHIKGGGRAPFLLLQRSSGEPTSNGSAVPGGERFVFKLLLMWKKSFVSLCFFTLCSVSIFCAFILKSSYKRKKCQTRQNPPIPVFLCPDVRNSCAQSCRVFRCPFVPFLRYLNMAKKNYLNSKMEGKIFMVKGHCELTIFKNSDTTWQTVTHCFRCKTENLKT